MTLRDDFEDHHTQSNKGAVISLLCKSLWAKICQLLGESQETYFRKRSFLKWIPWSSLVLCTHNVKTIIVATNKKANFDGTCERGFTHTKIHGKKLLLFTRMDQISPFVFPLILITLERKWASLVAFQYRIFHSPLEFQGINEGHVHIKTNTAFLTTPVLLPGSKRQPAVVSLIYAVMTWRQGNRSIFPKRSVSMATISRFLPFWTFHALMRHLVELVLSPWVTFTRREHNRFV